MEKRQHVWQRWKREYLHSLMENHRISRGSNSYPEVGEIVLIVGDEKNRGEWKKGKVVKNIRGRDDVVRGVKLLHKGHLIERPLSLVCQLEIKGTSVDAEVKKASENKELRRSTRQAAKDATERVRLLLKNDDN